MDMQLAKVPQNDFDWKSLDIYLFSNGQQQTPPRKYHFQAEDLTKWEATLKSLAASQYGNDCSIMYLYTTEGRKIESPVEIENEIAYVAVLPEDAFIYAGYKEYLLKASRSREKRLEKSRLPSYAKLPTNIHHQSGKLFKKKGDTERNKKNHFGATDKNKISRGKPRNLITQQNSSEKNGQAQAKKIFRNSSLRQNYSAIPPSVITRTSSQSKNNSKQMLERSGPDSEAPVVKNYLTKLTSKGLTEIKHSEENSQIENMNDISLQNQNINTVISNKNFTDTGQHKIDITEVAESMNTNISSIALSNAIVNDILFVKAILSSIIAEIPIIELSTNTNKGKPDTVTNNSVSYKNEGDAPKEPNKNEEVTSQNTINLISIVDKGDVIALNLKMVIRKGDGVITAKYNTNDYNSLNEKYSQIEIDEVSPRCLEGETQPTNAFKDYIRSDIRLHRSREQKCVCNEYYDFDEIMHKIANTENLAKKKIVFLTNDNKKNQTSCYQEIVQNFTQINDLNSVFLKQSERNNDQYANIECVTNDVGHSHNPNTNYMCMPNHFTDNSTQTEWSSLLVEARYHENNKYTFHLPSLRTLKEYFL